MHILITSEHATNFIPKNFETYFCNKNNLLNSHLALDLNAKACAKNLYNILKKNFSCSIHLAKISRLLLDHNRSLTNPKCWSRISKKFSASEKKLLIERYYDPYRISILNEIATIIATKKILHLSMHSFTNKLNNKIRKNDLGLLYDSRRKIEAATAVKLQKKLSETYNVRRNYPYLGKTDGLTSYIRKLYPETKYLGLEIEINQKLHNWSDIIQDLANSLGEILQ